MKRRFLKIKYTCITLLCMGAVFGCTSDQGAEVSVGLSKESTEEQTQQSAQETQNEPSLQEAEIADAYFFERQTQENVERFYDEAQEQGLEWKEAAKYLEVLTQDNLFQDGKMALKGLRIADIDGNGQMDMLVMVLDAKEEPYYGSGALWIYMNDDEPYCFSEEYCSYYGWFDVFWEDLDSDDNVEIVFSAQGTGCGAVGDFYKAVFKYRSSSPDEVKVERMQLPSDFDEDDDSGLRVEVYQEPEADRYTAYCPHFDEEISFSAQNAGASGPPDTAQLVGSEARGFYDLQAAEYEGKKVLQASEYLTGEGGTAHNAATAKFLITWHKNGEPEVLRWWIEEERISCANSHGNEISYADGYFYYADPFDRDYLYRVGKNGGEPQLLAAVPVENICVRDDVVYFVDRRSGRGIYQVQTDGSGMKELCGTGRDVQITGEYVYFRDVYEAQYDVSGLVAEKPAQSKDTFLYRMKRDGSARELIDTEVQQFVLSDGYRQEVSYIGAVYYTKYQYLNDGSEVELKLCQVGMDGQKNEELIGFRSRVAAGEEAENMSLVTTRLMVYGGKVYCVWSRWGENSSAVLFWYDLYSQKSDTISVPVYTDGCIYKGYFYGLCEREGDAKGQVFCVDLDSGASKTIYEYAIESGNLQENASTLHAIGEGVFFRRLVSERSGYQWFWIAQDGQVQEWRPSAAEKEAV